MRVLFFIGCLAATLLTSCVSQNKYRSALDREQQLQAENSRLNQEINSLNSRVTTLQNESANLAKKWEDAQKNASDLAGMANMTQQQLEAERSRLTDMRRLLDQQRSALENIRKKMTDALVGFSSNELTIFTKNGKVYVSLQENLLFPSGSAVVNPKGREALGKLAQVLNVNPEISVLIEGHTDSIPIKGRYEDNWALSTARATAIVRLLTDTYRVDPTRITASGRSKYEPIDSNETSEGRQRNRRTEIILAPKLDELMKLLEQPSPTADASST
ncbi:MAG TPA: OmpA family protein [Chitinophagaceae bacterium]|jgi:chemotaxis protein MotB|nr:OmpA family protein [Chitinophagaceae bacterium]